MKFKKFSIAVAIVSLGLPALLTGSTAQGATSYANRPKTILWVQPMKDHPVHKLMQAGFLKECKKLGYSCDIVGNASATKWDPVGTIPLVTAALAAKKYGYVAVYPEDPALYALTTKLAKQGYPVIGWHNLPKAGSVPGLLASAAENGPDVGKVAADGICSQIANKGTVAITEGSLNPIENAVAAGFKTELAAKCPAATTTAIGLEGFDPVKAVATAVGILSADSTIVAAFGTTGNSAQTWASAAKQSGRTITIIGVDYIRQNLDLVNSGAVYAVVAQPLYDESVAVVDLINQLHLGKKIAYSNIIPVGLVTKANIAKYYAIVKAAGD